MTVPGVSNAIHLQQRTLNHTDPKPLLAKPDVVVSQPIFNTSPPPPPPSAGDCCPGCDKSGAKITTQLTQVVKTPPPPPPTGDCCPGCDKSGAKTTTQPTQVIKTPPPPPPTGDCCPGCDKSGAKTTTQPTQVIKTPPPPPSTGDCCPGCDKSGSKPVSHKQPESINTAAKANTFDQNLKATQEQVSKNTKNESVSSTSKSSAVIEQSKTQINNKQVATLKDNGSSPITNSSKDKKDSSPTVTVKEGGPIATPRQEKPDIPTLRFSFTQDQLQQVLSLRGSIITPVATPTLPEAINKGIQTLAQTSSSAGDRIAIQTSTIQTMNSIPRDQQLQVMTALQSVAQFTPRDLPKLVQLAQKIVMQNNKMAAETVTTLTQSLAKLPETATSALSILQAVAHSAPKELPQTAKQMIQILSGTPKDATAALATLAKAADQTPKAAASMTQIAAQTTLTSPADTPKVAQQLAQIVSAAPKDAIAVLATLAKAADQAPKATAAMTQIAAHIATTSPLNTPHVSQQIAQIVSAAPHSAPALLATVAKVMVDSPSGSQMTTILASIAVVAQVSPKATEPMAQLLVQVATTNPTETSKVAQQLVQIVSAVPQSAPSLLAALVKLAPSPNPFMDRSQDGPAGQPASLPESPSSGLSSSSLAGRRDFGYVAKPPHLPGGGTIGSEGSSTLPKATADLPSGSLIKTIANLAQVISAAPQSAPSLLAALVKLSPSPNPFMDRSQDGPAGQPASLPESPSSGLSSSSLAGRRDFGYVAKPPHLPGGGIRLSEGATAVATATTVSPSGSQIDVRHPLATSISSMATVTRSTPSLTATVNQVLQHVMSTPPRSTVAVAQTVAQVAGSKLTALPQVLQTLAQVIASSSSAVITNLATILEKVAIKADSSTVSVVASQLAKIVENAPKEALAITHSIAQIAQQEPATVARTLAILTQTINSVPRSVQPMMLQVIARITPATQLALALSQIGQLTQTPEGHHAFQSLGATMAPGQSFGQLAARVQISLLQLSQFAKQDMAISQLQQFTLNQLLSKPTAQTANLQHLLQTHRNASPEELAGLIAQFLASLEEDELDTEKHLDEIREAKKEALSQKGFTEELQRMFENQEMEDWAAAAYFRQQTKKRAEEREKAWHK